MHLYVYTHYTCTYTYTIHMGVRGGVMYDLVRKVVRGRLTIYVYIYIHILIYICRIAWMGGRETVMSFEKPAPS